VTAARTSRPGALFVLLLLSLGCLVLWVGVPLAAMWLAGELTDSFAWHMPLALVLVVTGMVIFATLLSWLNDLYLRLTGGRMELHEDLPVRRRGPLESLLVAALLLAAVSFAVWFFVLAENPLVAG
jgi:hypothetical protein